MKKTILALALPLVIYGCSDNKATDAENVASFEKSYIAATNTVVNKSSEFSTGTMTYVATIKDENGKVTLKDDFDYADNQNSALVKYTFQSNADVDLKKYNAKNGIAHIVGTTTGNVSIEIPQTGDLIVLTNILANAKYNGELNEKAKSFGYTAKLDKNTIPVSVSGTNAAELTLNDLNSTALINFNDDYSAIKTFKSGFEGKNLTLKVVGPLAEEIQLTADLSKLAASTEYNTSPLKYNTTATLGAADVQFASGAESFNAKLKKLESKTSVQESNDQLSANLGYEIGEVVITKDQLAELNFGSLLVSTDIKGIKNIKNWGELIEKLNALSTQDPSELSDEESIEFLKLITSVLSKDTRIESVLENKLTIGDELKVDFAFQPSDALVQLLQNSQNPDEISMILDEKNPPELIDTYISEFKFVGKVTEGYLITQYEKFLTLNNQDPSIATNEVKGAIQMVVMLSAMQAAPLGVSPIKYEEGTLLIDISFKDGKWNINGKTLTTAEIFNAFQ